MKLKNYLNEEKLKPGMMVAGTQGVYSGKIGTILSIKGKIVFLEDIVTQEKWDTLKSNLTTNLHGHQYIKPSLYKTQLSFIT